MEFNPGVDLDSAAADIREATARVTRQLPDRVEQIRVIKADDNASPIVRMAVLSDAHDEETLTAIVENDIVPEFLSIEGVASVDMFGDRQRLLRVVIDPLRLSRFGLTVGGPNTTFACNFGKVKTSANTIWGLHARAVAAVRRCRRGGHCGRELTRSRTTHWVAGMV